MSTCLYEVGLSDDLSITLSSEFSSSPRVPALKMASQSKLLSLCIQSEAHPSKQRWVPVMPGRKGWVNVVWSSLRYLKAPLSGCFNTEDQCDSQTHPPLLVYPCFLRHFVVAPTQGQGLAHGILLGGICRAEAVEVVCDPLVDG